KGHPMNKLSDIYAMGMTFFRLLNQLTELEFNFTSQEDWLKAVEKNKYPKRFFLQHIPSTVRKIVNKSLNNDLSKRYSSANEFRRALEQLDLKIDWMKVNENVWEGHDIRGPIYKITKTKNRSGGKIEFFKDGRRDKSKCFSGIVDSLLEENFFAIICSSYN